MSSAMAAEFETDQFSPSLYAAIEKTVGLAIAEGANRARYGGWLILLRGANWYADDR